MSEPFIYKPVPDNPGKGGPVMLVPRGTPAPKIITEDGRTISGKFVNNGHHGAQYVFPPEIIGMKNMKVVAGGQTGTIANGSMSYRGNSFGGWSESSKGAVGSSRGGGFFGSGGVGPVGVGNYAFAPGYVGGLFPETVLANFDEIETAPYQYTDPFTFAPKYAETVRSEINKNNEQARTLGLDHLNTELEGLKTFAPVAAGIQKSLISEDNTFNQAERTKQVDEVLPGVRQQLTDQGIRAETFARGRFTSDIEDRGYELGIRSQAADISSAGGFGSSSSASRKASDLLSANARLDLSKYGDQALTQNISTKANLLMAPTQYANAGSQIRVMPSVDAGTRQSNAFGAINQNTLLPTTNAFTSEIGQQQYITNQEQRTREFNANGNWNESATNAAAQNTMNLQRFNYEAGYAGALAGAAQTNVNTEVGFQQQAAAQGAYNQGIKDQQSAANTSGIANVIGTAAPIIDRLLDSDGDGVPDDSDVNIPDFGTSGNVDDFADTGGTSSEFYTPPVDGTNFVEPDFPDFGTSGGADDFGNLGSDSYSTDSSLQMSSMKLARYDDFTPEIDKEILKGDEGVSEQDLQDFKSFVNDNDNISADSEDLPALEKTIKSLNNSAKSILDFAGVSDQPLNGFVKAGYTNTGKPYYADPTLLNSTDTLAGSKVMNQANDILVPFTAFDMEGTDALLKMGNLSSDLEFHKQLDAAFQVQDFKAFNSFIKQYTTGA